MDDKHFDDSADTLPTFDDNESSKSATISTRTMLKDPEEEATEKVDNDEEKSSIERKTAYDNLAQKEHFFSKATLEVDKEFEQQMLKKKELNEEHRAELMAKELRAKKAQLLHEIEVAQREGRVTDAEAKFAELERLSELTGGTKRRVQTNDLANELNRKISQSIHEDKKDISETEKSIHKGILAAIALEIAMVFIFTPNQIFIFPTIVKYVLAIISIVLALSSVIFLIIMGNMAEKHVMPKSQNILFLSASILPGAILRAVFGTLLANAFEFIPVAGIYIGYCFGVAIGSFLHYILLRRYHIQLNEATSIINSAVTVALFIIPNLVSGTINQPMDQKSQFGSTIYLIEAVFIVVVDEIIFKLMQLKDQK